MSAAPPPSSVVEAMRHGAMYPGGPEVVVRETHSAWVFLAGERAYKVKKPVRMAFLDFSTLERRRAVCHEEVRVNAPLAATLEMRVRAVVARDGGYALTDSDAPDAVEYAIEMRRFDEDRTMAALIRRGELRAEHVQATARRLAEFHAAAHAIAPSDPVGDVKRACDRNARELLALADDATARRILAATRFTDAYLVAHRHALVARAAAGRTRDGHGDLRAEHVVLEQPLAIVDRLEFDARLREIDVADDLAFLVMDLERLGAGAFVQPLVAAYRAAGGDPGDDALIAFHAVYRALVRAKVDLLRAGQLDDAAAANAARSEADELVALAERFAWRARGPLVLAVGGPPASGKSTLAARLARRSGWAVLSSDALRKLARGIDLADQAPEADYTRAARAAVYRQLGERGRAAVAADQGVIVDATFGDPTLRAAFLDGLGDRGALRAIECHTPAALREHWALERTARTAHGSDAAPTVAAQLGAHHTGWDELSEEMILTVRPGAGADAAVDQIADWLDMRSVVCPAAARPHTDAGGASRN
ncbi:MAG: AAA family ATPase [Solirubrobacteraceae bacterium]|nr:AAA family ATPase [Solirubrobacteraceae bacterium]